MLYTLFVLWAFAVAVSTTLLALVVTFQGVARQLRRLTDTAHSTPQGVTAEA